MKNSRKLAVCSLVSALSLVVMIAAYFPYLTIALPAVAGSLLIVLVVEVDSKWALTAYFAVAILSLIICNKEAAIMFVAFFGYYPILKFKIEKLSNFIIIYLIKFIVLNSSVGAAYYIAIKLFALPLEEMGDFGEYSIFVLIIAANVVFVLYDIAIERLMLNYKVSFHKAIFKIIRGK